MTPGTFNRDGATSATQCRYCGSPMILADNQREAGDRIIAANRFWKECERNDCRARGPVRSSIAEAERAANEL